MAGAYVVFFALVLLYVAIIGVEARAHRARGRELNELAEKRGP